MCIQNIFKIWTTFLLFYFINNIIITLAAFGILWEGENYHK